MSKPMRFTGDLWSLGFIAVLAPPLLLAISVQQDRPWLVFGCVLLLFPLARLVTGGYPIDEQPRTAPLVASLLSAVPRLYAVALTGAIALLLWRFHAQPLGLGDVVPWMLSLWMTLLFGTCVSHALLHGDAKLDRLIGHALAGLVGYPMLAYEHIRHHHLSGQTGPAEWPALDESLWRFAYRRLSRIGSETLGPKGLVWWGPPRSPTVTGLRIGLAATTSTLTLFSFVAGWQGALIYAVAAFLVAFGVQVVTYIQHWGLGDDQIPDARQRGLAWEDDCRFQGWLTLNLSLHQSHHDDAVQPYYELHMSRQSPRLPAGYLLLMFAAAAPPLWRKVMGPALEYWRANPGHPPSAGRRVACVAVYRRCVGRESL